MTKIDDGGAAFPAFGDGPNVPYQEPGMSLRDWFAGQALAGLTVFINAGRYEKTASFADITAQRAYEYADAMLRARAPNQDSDHG